MKMRILQAILLLATVALSISCTRNDTDEGGSQNTPVEGDIAIEIQATINTSDFSPSKSEFADGDCIGIYAINYKGSSSSGMSSRGNQADNVPYNYDKATDTWSSPSKAHYRDAETAVDIIGYYPHMEIDDACNATMTVALDQSRAEHYAEANILWANRRNTTPSEDVVELSFKPVLAYIEVQLTRGEEWSEQEWAQATKQGIVRNTLTDIKFNLALGSVAPITSSQPCDIAMLNDGDTLHAVVAPQSIKSNTVLFRFTIDDTIYDYKVEKSTTFEAGKRYTFEYVVDKQSGTPPPTGDKLSGEIIGTRYSVDYNTSARSESVNTKDNLFDGDLTTFFASYERSNTWAGLDLGTPHIITRIGYAPRPTQPTRVVTALIEGANNADFSDALPIYIIREAAPENVMTYVDVSCSRGFRYVRYATPNDKRCNLAELEFYGIEGAGDDSQLYQLTNLPTVVINTDGGVDITSKEVETNSHVFIISDEGTELLADSETGVRGRGNASWDFPKKPYRLKFSEKRSPLGAPAKAKKWTLISNHGDKTLMRNILAFEISRRLGLEYTPFCQPVDLILNGEYKGCYQLCDQIEVAENRVDITEMKKGDTSGENLKGGYLIEIDAYAYNETSMFYSYYGTPVTIKSPDDEDITYEQSNYINSFYNTMESAVFTKNLTDTANGYRRYLDVESFLRHFIVGEFAGNTDTYWSVYMYKDRTSDKLYVGPVWDYDLAFENDYRTYPINSLSDYIYASLGSVASEAVRKMVNYIVKDDPMAHARLIEIWDEAQRNGLDAASLLEYVDETAALLDESQKLNFKRWPILDQYVHMNFQALGSYEAEVGTVRNYIEQRVVTLDRLIRQ